MPWLNFFTQVYHTINYTNKYKIYVRYVRYMFIKKVKLKNVVIILNFMLYKQS